MSKGFSGRKYLTDAEHETYLKRMPVRYIRHKLSTLCSVCGLPGTQVNPLQNAHLVPFNLGIKRYRLTPDWLDSETNIVTAHRTVCNKHAELSVEAISSLLEK